MRTGKPRNPFSVQFHGPGATPYLFEEAAAGEWPALLARLDQERWRVDITGPHGIGKSTLLHSLQAEAARRGQRTVLAKIDPEWPHLSLANLWAAALNDVLFLDSAELLPRWERALLVSITRMFRRGLVVTTHLGGMLPFVHRPAVSAGRFHQVLERLIGEKVQDLVRPPEEWLTAANGSVRQAIFDLYDAFERDEAFRDQDSENAIQQSG